MIRSKLAILSIFLALLFMCKPMLVTAHNPSSVSLEYDSGTDTLTVTVDHSVSASGLLSHYINNIVIEKNSVQEHSRNYEGYHNTIYGVIDNFTVVAVDGDVLTATAVCTLSGIGNGQITIGTTTPTGNGGNPIDAMVIAIVVIVIGVVAVVIVLIRRR